MRVSLGVSWKSALSVVLLVTLETVLVFKNGKTYYPEGNEADTSPNKAGIVQYKIMNVDDYQIQHHHQQQNYTDKEPNQGQAYMQGAFRQEPWKSRSDALQTGCASSLRNTYNLTAKQVSQTFYTSSKAGFTVCKVPKAGSSFWTMVYLALERETSPDEIFSMPRHKLHAIGSNMGTSKPDNRSSLNVIVSRDPYSRLFSGFIDKFYLLGMSSMSDKIGKENGRDTFKVRGLQCGYSLSFEDFLGKITDDALKGKSINQHWAPVYLLCGACSTNYHAVSHTDTLTSDTEYIVDNLPVSSVKKSSLKKMFHGKGTEKTLSGMIKTLLTQQVKNSSRCPDRLAFVYKLWKSLQIQGFLHNESASPWDFFQQNENLNEDYIIDKVLETIADKPLSSSERERQRRAALVSAYKSVKPEIISKIRQMYMMDFLLFNFDMNPPK